MMSGCIHLIAKYDCGSDSVIIITICGLMVLCCNYLYAVYAQETGGLFITQGIASGDITDRSAVIWLRANKEALMHVQYDTDHNFSDPKPGSAIANRATDFTAQAKLEGLKSDSIYYYQVWFSSKTNEGRDMISDSMIGTFRTAPSLNRSSNQPINFVFGGDVGGGDFCRREHLGYAIFSVIRALSPDFFVFMGDQIYPDTSRCRKDGPPLGVVGWENIEANLPSIITANWTNPTELLDTYLRHWEYNRNDNHLQNLLRNTSLYSQPDDHEVIADYGGNWSYLPGKFKDKLGFPNLVTAGMKVFFEFSPIDGNNGEQMLIYRSFSWGLDLDLFILDTRSYRSRNNIVDATENNKTLLGKEQIEWLKQGLATSTATWKIVATSVPMTIPTCHNSEAGCDGWATDGISNKTFVRERSDLLRFLDENNIKNVVFIVTDVHFPASIKVNDDFDGDGSSIIFHELITGPLSAEPLDISKKDPTINATYLYKENRIFNFGHVDIRKIGNGDAHIFYEVRDDNGIARPNSKLHLVPQSSGIDASK